MLSKEEAAGSERVTPIVPEFKFNEEEAIGKDEDVFKEPTKEEILEEPLATEILGTKFPTEELIDCPIILAITSEAELADKTP